MKDSDTKKPPLGRFFVDARLTVLHRVHWAPSRRW